MKTIALIFTAGLLFVKSPFAYAQNVYGDNAGAGNYFDVGDAKIYYELYGQGKPIVLLHGGLFGYISAFEFLIPKLARNHQVIAIGTRGHGKSEIGRKPFSYIQLAEDAYRVIRHITKDSVLVIGFSDGGITGYNLAAHHRELVRGLVAMGSPRRPSDRTASRNQDDKMTSVRLEAIAPGFAQARKKLMPDASRWEEFLDKLHLMWNTPDFVPEESLRQIECPVLLMAGDRDVSLQVEKLLETFRLLSNAQLSLMPDCEHVILECNPAAVWAAIVPFIH